MVNITFLLISKGHEANLKHCCCSGHLVLRPLPQFLGAFLQGQMPNHTGNGPLLALTLEIHLIISTAVLRRNCHFISSFKMCFSYLTPCYTGEGNPKIPKMMLFFFPPQPKGG
jgi:hypothetical protein